jgi:hypothetical protein
MIIVVLIYNNSLDEPMRYSDTTTAAVSQVPAVDIRASMPRDDSFLQNALVSGSTLQTLPQHCSHEPS